MTYMIDAMKIENYSGSKNVIIKKMFELKNLSGPINGQGHSQWLQ
jgi:hypothetical protein